MVKFKELGFNSFDEYKKFFFDNLLPSNKTYEYFVDWDKVKNMVKKHLVELSLLNSLTKIDASNRDEHFRHLLKDYPKIIEVIPLLIAERAVNGKIDIFDPETEKFLSFEFKSSKVNEDTVSQIINFCNRTGIMDLFGQVRDIYDYLLGVEVGLDTNARKNRSGNIFEKMCQQKISKIIEKEFGKEYKVVNNDPNFSLYPVVAGGKSKGKTHDVVVYKDGKPVLIAEFNFYNITGSKPTAIAESYIEMQKAAKDRNVKFLWVTDGPAWRKMKQHLLLGMENIDYVLNYRMMERVKNILK